jgi:hypothetical protein
VNATGSDGVTTTAQDLKDRLAAVQSQIQQLQQQSQETRDLVDRICAWPPIKWWLRRAIRLGDLNQEWKGKYVRLCITVKGLAALS